MKLGKIEIIFSALWKFRTSVFVWINQNPGKKIELGLKAKNKNSVI